MLYYIKVFKHVVDRQMPPLHWQIPAKFLTVFYIEIIDKSTKWRIEKGILVGPRLLRQGISRGCRERKLFFQLKSLQKILYRDLNGKKVSKNPFQWALCTKSNSLKIAAEMGGGGGMGSKLPRASIGPPT